MIDLTSLIIITSIVFFIKLNTLPVFHKKYNYDPNEYEFIDYEVIEKRKKRKPKKGVIYE